MRVFSMASMAVMTRAAPSNACWKVSMFVVSWSVSTEDTDDWLLTAAAALPVASVAWLVAALAVTPIPTTKAAHLLSGPVVDDASWESLSAVSPFAAPAPMAPAAIPVAFVGITLRLSAAFAGSMAKKLRPVVPAAVAPVEWMALTEVATEVARSFYI